MTSFLNLLWKMKKYFPNIELIAVFLIGFQKIVYLFHKTKMSDSMDSDLTWNATSNSILMKKAETLLKSFHKVIKTIRNGFIQISVNSGSMIVWSPSSGFEII